MNPIDLMERKTENSGRIDFSFDEPATIFLLKEANIVYNTEIQILLLNTLVTTIGGWINKCSIVVEIENFGRQLDGVDVSRTVGWFTTLYPIELDYIANDLGAQIKSIKDRMRKVPENGIGYGIFKYVIKSLSSIDSNKCSSF